MEETRIYMVPLGKMVATKNWQADYYCLELRGLNDDHPLKEAPLRTIVALQVALDRIYGPNDIHSNVDGHSAQLSLGYKVIDDLEPWNSSDGFCLRAVSPVHQQT